MNIRVKDVLKNKELLIEVSSYAELIEELKKLYMDPKLIANKKIIGSDEELNEETTYYIVEKEAKILTSTFYMPAVIQTIEFSTNIRNICLADRIIIKNYYIKDGIEYIHNIDDKPAIIIKNPLGEIMEEIWFQHNVITKKKGKTLSGIEYKFEYGDSTITSIDIKTDKMTMKMNRERIMTYEDETVMKLVQYSMDGSIDKIIETVK